MSTTMPVASVLLAAYCLKEMRPMTRPGLSAYGWSLHPGASSTKLQIDLPVGSRDGNRMDSSSSTRRKGGAPQAELSSDGALTPSAVSSRG